MSDTYTLEAIREEQARRQAQREQEARSTRLQATAGGESISLEAIRREQARRSSEREAPQQPQRTAQQEASGGLASLNQGLYPGFGDEIVGAQGYLLEGARELGDQLSRGEFDWSRVGDRAQQGYRSYTDHDRGALSDFRSNRPLASAAVEGIGSAAPILATGGQAVLPTTARGGFGALANQTARAATAGAAYGYGYGFGAGDGDLGERLDSANESAAFGAALGAVAPAAINTFSGVASWANDVASPVVGALRRERPQRSVQRAEFEPLPEAPPAPQAAGAVRDTSPEGVLSNQGRPRSTDEWAHAEARGLPLDEASRMQRAREMGFDVDTPLYHGTDQEFAAFRRGEDGTRGPGIYMTSDPQTANWYAGADDGGNILPLYARNAQTLSAGNGQVTAIVRDPSDVRSGFSAFDPEYRSTLPPGDDAILSAPADGIDPRVAAGGRGALSPPTPPTPPEAIPNAARGTILRMADRARLGADDVEGALVGARENPQGQVLADLFDDPGVRTTRAIAQAPGQTGQRAAEVARTRFQEAPDRIMNSLQRRLSVGESPADAMRALERDYADAASFLYNPLWERPVTAQQTAMFEQRIAPLLDDPIMQDAMRRGEEIFARDVRLGSAQGGVQDNLPRYLHLIKMGLDDAIGAARRNPTGIQSTEMRGVMELRRRYLAAVDETVPGYAEARARWGGLREAEDALEQGAGFLQQRPDEIAQAMAELSPFAQHHARIGLAAQIETQLGLRGSVNGNRNVAEALGSPEMQRRVAAAFESPQQAADFLDTLNTQNRLMRNAGQWGSGSSTYSNATHGADEALHALADAGVNVATGNVGGAVRRGVQGLANTATFGAVERANNQRGEALLRRIDGPEARAFADEVVRILRARDASRQAADALAAPGGAAAAAGRRE